MNGLEQVHGSMRMAYERERDDIAYFILYFTQTFKFPHHISFILSNSIPLIRTSNQVIRRVSLVPHQRRKHKRERLGKTGEVMQNASISTSARPTQEKQNLRSSYICVCVSVPVRTCATQVQTHANVSCEKMFLLMLASCMSSPVLRLRVRGPGLKTNYSNEAQRFPTINGYAKDFENLC